MNYDNEAIVRTPTIRLRERSGYPRMDRQLHRGWSVQQRHRRRIISRRASKRRRNRLWTNVSRRSRELHRVNVMGDVVAIELSIQGTFRGRWKRPPA